MALINMDYIRKSIPEKIAKSKLFINCIANNINFATPNPTLDTLINHTHALETAYTNSQDGSKAAKAALKLAEATLNADISILGAYLQSASGGDEQKIISAGALVKKRPDRLGELPAPAGLIAKIGANEGAIDCRWTSAKGAKSYIVQVSSNLAGTMWVHCNVSTAAKCSATGLESGKKYIFRVAALGAAGQSPWSDPAVSMAG